jgi:hypothetical protein
MEREPRNQSSSLRSHENYQRFCRKDSIDNQTQIALSAGSEISVKPVIGGLKKITAEKPCTKNGKSSFYVSDAELIEITS